MRYIFLLFLISVALLCEGQKQYSSSGGTTTVTIETKDSIWMAADSKKVLQTNTGNYSAYNLKIINKGNFFFDITSSYVQMHNEKMELVFDAENILYETIQEKEPFEFSFYMGNTAIIERLNEVYKTMPSYLKRKIDSTLWHPIMQIVMVGNKSSLDYKASDIGLVKVNGEFKFDCFEKTLSHIFPSMYFTGFSEKIKERVISDYIFDEHNYKQELIDLISLEIDAHPEAVGGTIDVIVIYKNGYKWLTNNKY